MNPSSLFGANLIGADLYEADLREGKIAEKGKRGELQILQHDIGPAELPAALLASANLERAKEQVPKVRAIDPDLILQACIFEIVTTQVEEVPVPDWAFKAFNLPVETRNFRYNDMLSPDGRRVGWTGRVPDRDDPATNREEAPR